MKYRKGRLLAWAVSDGAELRSSRPRHNVSLAVQGQNKAHVHMLTRPSAFTRQGYKDFRSHARGRGSTGSGGQMCCCSRSWRPGAGTAATTSTSANMLGSAGRMSDTGHRAWSLSQDPWGWVSARASSHVCRKVKSEQGFLDLRRET